MRAISAPHNQQRNDFEEGIRLSKNCLKILEEAEHRVEVLVQEKNGKKRIHAYTPDDVADESSP
jgi:exodeoxyribonuclease VII small subunit